MIPLRVRLGVIWFAPLTAQSFCNFRLRRSPTIRFTKVPHLSRLLLQSNRNPKYSNRLPRTALQKSHLRVPHQKTTHYLPHTVPSRVTNHTTLKRTHTSRYVVLLYPGRGDVLDDIYSLYQRVIHHVLPVFQVLKRCMATTFEPSVYLCLFSIRTALGFTTDVNIPNLHSVFIVTTPVSSGLVLFRRFLYRASHLYMGIAICDTIRIATRLQTTRLQTLKSPLCRSTPDLIAHARGFRPVVMSPFIEEVAGYRILQS